MHPLRKMIPSANSIFVFEAAARLRSFKAAAGELNVTQPAITYAIRQFEGALGLKLFHRRHRGVELTGDGAKLYQDVHDALEVIYRSARALKTVSSEDTVEIAISTSMATSWLLPRLSDFRRDHPEIEIRFYAVEKDVHPGKESVDLTIRHGHGDWPGLDTWEFLNEEIFPVCSPSYLSSAPELNSIADLENHHILHLQEPYRVRMGWNSWLQSLNADFRITHGDTFTDAQLLFQAAIEGQGICLGWLGINDLFLKQGLLVRPLEASVRTGNSFYIVAASDSLLSPKACALRDWMLKQSHGKT